MSLSFPLFLRSLSLNTKEREEEATHDQEVMDLAMMYRYRKIRKRFREDGGLRDALKKHEGKEVGRGLRAREVTSKI